MLNDYFRLCRRMSINTNKSSGPFSSLMADNLQWLPFKPDEARHNDYCKFLYTLSNADRQAVMFVGRLVNKLPITVKRGFLFCRFYL